MRSPYLSYNDLDISQDCEALILRVQQDKLRGRNPVSEDRCYPIFALFKVHERALLWYGFMLGASALDARHHAHPSFASAYSELGTLTPFSW